MTTQFDPETPTPDAITMLITGLHNTLDAISQDPIGLHRHRIIEPFTHLAAIARHAEADATRTATLLDEATEENDALRRELEDNHHQTGA